MAVFRLTRPSFNRVGQPEAGTVVHARPLIGLFVTFLAHSAALCGLSVDDCAKRKTGTAWDFEIVHTALEPLDDVGAATLMEVMLFLAAPRNGPP